MVQVVTALLKKSQPAYTLKFNGKNQGLLLGSELVSISVSLSKDAENDTLQIEIIEPDPIKKLLLSPSLSALKSGAEIDISLGYENNKSFLGTFFVDTITRSGGSGSVTRYSITATSIDPSKSYYDKCRRQWVLKGNAVKPKEPLEENQLNEVENLGDIIKKIASIHELEHKISSSLSSQKINKETQFFESDINFLNRLAKKYAAGNKETIVKITQKKLVFIENDTKVGATTIHADQVSNWSLTEARQFRFGKIKAYYHLLNEGDTHYIEVDNPLINSNDPNKDKVHEIRKYYASEAEAERAANKVIAEFRRQTDALQLSIIGDATIVPLHEATVKNVHPLLKDSKWQVNTVSHNLNASGFTTSLTLQKQ